MIGFSRIPPPVQYDTGADYEVQPVVDPNTEDK